MEKAKIVPGSSEETVDLSNPGMGLEDTVNFFLPNVGVPVAQARHFKDSNFSHLFRGRILRGTELGEEVMVKVMRHDRIDEGAAVETFHREIQIHEAVQSHPLNREREALVKLHTHGVIDGMYDAGPEMKPLRYMITEFAGTDAETLIKDPSVPIGYKLWVVREGALRLEVVHEAGYAHRDWKPSNLVLSNGKPKLIDLGLAKGIGDREDIFALKGTVHYMSPELIESGKVDSRTDIFAIGVTLYEAFEGHHPYAGKRKHPYFVIGSILRRGMIPMKNPAAIYSGYADVIGRCLSKNPNERYDSIPQLVASMDCCGIEYQPFFQKS